MIDRFTGVALMGRIAPQQLLALYAVLNVLLCIVAAGMAAVIALGATRFFMSIMFPTIFALGIKDIGEHARIGSSLIVMAIIGGAPGCRCCGCHARFARKGKPARKPLARLAGKI